MAQPMMHLLIADKVYIKTQFIDSYGDFLLGSIAPDAVHVKENYIRELKDISQYKKKLLLHTTYISEQQIRDYIENCAEKCTEYLEYLPYFQSLQ